MTTIYNVPSEFTSDATAGFLRLYPDLVEGVYGGVVRSTQTPDGKVAVVIGGGSGHYPAFAGWVGPGLADGAVVGNIFASPSTQQVYSVAKAAERGGGVFFSYGNYAGDVLNFDLAQDRLRAEGIPAATVAVSDDVTSASAEDVSRRRGTAGDLVVFKIAGAAAEAGYDLDGVTEAASRANLRTQSFAVAFAGCTLPGASEPLFEVPVGRMGVGMGVHGEPGISEEDIVPSHELASMLVERLLTERPAQSSGRVVALVNGLGGTKYEELFVLWNDIARLLEEAGLTIVAPEVGELITSLDMAGVSLTLVWLDDELEALWTAPTQTPAFSRGSVLSTQPRAHRTDDAEQRQSFAAASESSRAAARSLLSKAETISAAIVEAEDDLGHLDAVAGDGDHGRGMTTGTTAALAALREAVESGAGLASALASAGDAWADKAGGTSGALWGTGLRAASAALSDQDAPADSDVVAAVRAALDHVLSFGKAHRGDKTLLDALIPFAETLQERVGSGGDLGEAWDEAAQVATKEAAATADLRPLVGRARPLAERSVGHPDPGAVSLALIMTVAGR